MTDDDFLGEKHEKTLRQERRNLYPLRPRGGAMVDTDGELSCALDPRGASLMRVRGRSPGPPALPNRTCGKPEIGRAHV